MAIHLLPPVTPVPPGSEQPTATGPGLDPFWDAVRRRRPDLPLVLLGAGPGPGPGPEVEGGRDR